MSARKVNMSGIFPLDSLDDLTLEGLQTLKLWVEQKIEEVEREEREEEEQLEIEE
jgi:hypothetical protein